jgi:osmotically inducible protein OsmC
MADPDKGADGAEIPFAPALDRIYHPSRRFQVNLQDKESAMPVRNADAVWEGDLKGGQGKVKLGSGAFEGKYSFSSRFEQGGGTNPEELLGAAHAGCYSMALSAGLGKAGFSPKRVHTTARVSIDKVGEGFKITRILLQTEAQVPGLDDAAFQKIAKETKAGCPVSQALSATPIDLEAKLVQ